MHADPPAVATTPPDAATCEASPLRFTVRPLQGAPELRAAVACQVATWGTEYQDVVPASLLKVAVEVGGVALGAFDPQGRLLGFVFGLTGPRDGELSHWSHLLAVAPEHRDRGIGSALKRAQAAELVDRGVHSMHWTFDPLVARNAHLNLNHLGIAIARYVPEMYGDTGSPVHSFGTDRFIATWELDGERPSARLRSRNALPARSAGAPTVSEANMSDPLVRIPVPDDIEAVAAVDPSGARAWRERSRDAFLRSLDLGFTVIGFVRGAGGADGYYVLSRDPSDRAVHEA